MEQEKKPTDIPYIVYESTIDHLERIIKKLWILALIIFLAFVASNSFWIWYEGQYSTVSTTNTTVSQDIDSDGDTNVTGTGDVSDDSY